MYKLTWNPKYIYNAPFIMKFEKEECASYDWIVHDIVKTWWGIENKFKADNMPSAEVQVERTNAYRGTIARNTGGSSEGNNDNSGRDWCMVIFDLHLLKLPLLRGLSLLYLWYKLGWGVQWFVWLSCFTIKNIAKNNKKVI